MDIENISLIRAGIHRDKRGALIFFNTFDMKEVKRFYVIEHPDVDVIRAWQGHRHEQKWFYVIAGAFKFAVIKPDHWQYPSAGLRPEIYLLEASQPTVLHVAGGYATGFQALEDQSRIMVFSDASVEDSQKDDYRFDKELWKGIWT